MLNLGETSTQINKGIITLIPKSRDHSKLGNWHPITFLGSLYKILAKVWPGDCKASYAASSDPIREGLSKGEASPITHS
jgi:hypothetical protein